MIRRARGAAGGGEAAGPADLDVWEAVDGVEKNAARDGDEGQRVENSRAAACCQPSSVLWTSRTMLEQANRRDMV